MAVGAARAHLWAVGWQPAHFQAFAHPHLGEKLAQKQNSLSAESGDLDAEMAEVVMPARGNALGPGLALAFY